MKITVDQARTFMVKYHGLNKRKRGQKSIIEIIDTLGCIQYDPLNVVGRNPDLVLQARIKNYNPEMLYDLLYKDRLLLDGWDKQMSIYSVKDYPYFNNEFYLGIKLKSFEGVLRRRQVLDALEYKPEVLAALEEFGPMKPSKIELGSMKRVGSWGHGRMSSVVMDYMYHEGTLIVHHKQGVQKIYGLASKYLDEELFYNPFGSLEDLYKWHFYRRVGSLGLTWNKPGGAWQEWYLSKRDIRTRILNELVIEGKLTEITIEGIDQVFYVQTDSLYLFEDISMKNEMRFLAPLDNFMWDRNMIKALFDFEYTWEVYTPKDKRKYGYYILPILYRNKLVGRFEPIIDKKEKRLVIQNIWWESKPTKSMLKAYDKALEEFNKYLGFEV